MSAPGDADDFAGTARFEIRRRLGAGGMGVVYQAWDRDRGELVALKTLQHVSPAALFRFKREFRALAGVSHPSLVALHELVADGERWFFTMECVDGTDFLSWVSEPAPDDAPAPRPHTQTMSQGADDTAVLPARVPRRQRTSEPRLRAALRGLATGVATLHAAGYLHRDIKPSNVMVTAEGRVVLMDFGVAVRHGGADPGDIVGTPAYLAPEQGNGESTEASDWYSVGVMLFEALTGDRPFRGDARSVIEAKQQGDAPAPAALNPAAPADLADLCTELLCRDPDARPTPERILARLSALPGQRAVDGRADLDAEAGAADALLVGRDDLLAELRAAHAEARGGAGSTVYVHGSSGMGKTTLVERLLRDVRADPDAVIIAAKCYEQQSVPYRAIDGMVDALCQYLVGQPAHRVDALLPRHVQPLARVFPVLRRVPAIATACLRDALATPDPHELRRRAFEGLRELLARLAERKPLVVVIDDLQWGDLDSAPLLADLMQPPHAPPLLFIACYRSEDAERSQLLRALFRRASRLGPAARVRTLAVEPLAEADAAELARRLLLAGGVRPELADEIAREARGIPYLVHELVRFAIDARGGDDAPRTPAPSLDRVIGARVDLLSPGARATLDLIAAAGQPLAHAVLVRALGGSISAVDLGILRSGLLVRTTRLRDTDVIDVHHDRIRETVLARLGEDAGRDCHRRLALALAETGSADAERLAAHFLAAGDTGAGAAHALRAADEAAGALAFERAAYLYDLVWQLQPLDADGELALLVKLADALANAGRGTDAAAVYLAAADRAAPARADELRRNAALQSLHHGDVDQGLATLRVSLAASGLRLPSSPARAVSTLLWQRARLGVRGLGFRERAAAEVADAELGRIDACWTAVNGLSMVDPVSGAAIQARHLRLALGAGELSRIARALAVNIGYASLAGLRAQPRVDRLVERATGITDWVGDVETRGWLHTCVGFAEYQFGRFAAARQHCERAVQVLRDGGAGMWWQLATAELYVVWACFYTGDFAEVRRRVQSMLAEARLRGDRYTVANLKTGLPSSAWLAEDRADAAREGATGAMASWSRAGFQLQHYWELHALAHADLYAGDGALAHQRVETGWRDLRRSLLLRIQLVRIEARSLRGRAALAAAAARPAGERAPLLDIAVREARHIEREGVDWARPFAALLHAGVACLGGDPEATVAHLQQAERSSAAAGLGALGASARRLRGVVTGGPEGAALSADGERWLLGAGVAAPPAMSRFLAPGIEPVS